ncbi:adenylate/guanylate cyclase domain-containing protein [Shimia abyssi]|uniref:Adenylate/guanylate cyclase n=1 Tax=Shimia abyssi TaxID=1662395 RepID=A0A2P8FEQ7_9RHOB|nr:adenylate/guanylate cyclase domain-containing protein [Shimia abyssi]PSL20210.1 adenylate/guanylate cyclase [Shimia abyssi]
MATSLWQGNWRTKARITSGLILFTYVFWHLLAVGMGLFSLDLMHTAQEMQEEITESLPGAVLLYGGLLTHLGLALHRIAMRRTLRMPFVELLQVILGLTIPFLLWTHIVHTRIAQNDFGVEAEMGYIAGLIWNTQSGWNQAVLLLIVWIHGCIGLHYWLRTTALWRRLVPVMITLATLIPAFSLAGFLTQGRLQRQLMFAPDTGPALRDSYNFPTSETFQSLASATERGIWVFSGLLVLTAVLYAGRKLLINRGSLRIRYIDGPEISGQRGMTLLEMSRANGVPHMALCGGRGRCTTCRVMIEHGQDLLHPPSPEETASLAAVNAPANARLACQIRPTDPATVLRVFRADGRRAREHQSLGQERRLAILFLDMRGFTARTTGQLPYDVVFLLNRFFDAIVPSITSAGGTIDKYLGDGLLALFELETEQASAEAALKAAAGIGSALQVFNRAMVAEGSDPVAIGMGLHLGDLVLGEIGAAENAPRTIIGDTVNAASRLEAKTKDLGVETLVSRDVLLAAGVDLAPLKLQLVELRGVAQPLSVLAVPRAANLPALLGAPL